MKGYTDKAADKDLFEIKNYIDGLRRFIVSCNTPMTISIQGTWGTGKTSVMNLIQNGMTTESVQCIWFNTWQFSQFSMGDELPISLLHCLLDEFNLPKEHIKDFKTILKVLGKGAKNIVLSYADYRISGESNGEVKNTVNSLNGTDEYDNPAKAIKELKEKFKESVDKTLEINKKERLVIFIDDLDRLEPKKAVELLEVLKIFLDCEKCVFVLAIDYDVVCRGVEAKYGKLSDDSKADKDKGRSFFDKIIQVPFKMPVANYNITNYVKKCFDDIGLKYDEKDLPIYEALIRKSIGTNPRAMKRLFNAYLLLETVISDEALKETGSRKILFATLCLQHYNEKVYNYIVRNRNSFTVEQLITLAKGTHEEIEKEIDDIDLSADEVESIRAFMAEFVAVVDSDGKDVISQSEFEEFIKVLGLSTITSADDDSAETKRVRVLVGMQDFKKGNQTIETIEGIISLVENTVGEFGNHKFINTSNCGHILFTKNGKKYTDVYCYAGNRPIQIDCVAGANEVFTREDILPIIEKHGIELGKYQKGKMIVFTYRGKEDNEDYAKILKACYESM